MSIYRPSPFPTLNGTVYGPWGLSRTRCPCLAGRGEQYLEPAGTACDNLAGVFASPSLAKAQTDRVRVVGPELRRGPQSGQVGRGDEVKDLHGVARQDLVHVERSEMKIDVTIHFIKFINLFTFIGIFLLHP